MVQIIKPPEKSFGDPKNYKVFLGGTIDNGNSEDWQKIVQDEFEDVERLTFFNPRRDDWNPEWQDGHPELDAQIHWELDRLARVDLKVFYFAPGSISPITFLELGGYGANDYQTIVCAPEGFWRKANVRVFCDRRSIHRVETLDEVIERIRTSVEWMLAKERWAEEDRARAAGA